MTKSKSQPNKPPVTLARMKMDSSRIHAYWQLNHSREGYLTMWVPSWLAPNLHWDAMDEKWYFRASDGERVYVPAGHYVVQMPTKWPLIVSPDGFEADWFPLSPGDDGYDVLATDNAITREDESPAPIKTDSIWASPEMKKIVTRSNELTKEAVESLLGPTHSLDFSDEFTRSQLQGISESDSVIHSLDGDQTPIEEIIRMSVGGSMAAAEQERVKKVFGIRPKPAMLSDEGSASPVGIFNESQTKEIIALALHVFKQEIAKLSGPPMIRVPDSDMETIERITGISEPGPLMPMKSYMETEKEAEYQRGFNDGHIAGYAKCNLDIFGPNPSEEKMSNDDYWYERGKAYGKTEILQSVREALRSHGLDTTQSSESESERSSGEEAAFTPEDWDLTKRISEYANGSSQGEDSDRSVKQIPIDRRGLKPLF